MASGGDLSERISAIWSFLICATARLAASTSGCTSLSCSCTAACRSAIIEFSPESCFCKRATSTLRSDAWWSSERGLCTPHSVPFPWPWRCCPWRWPPPLAFWSTAPAETPHRCSASPPAAPPLPACPAHSAHSDVRMHRHRQQANLQKVMLLHQLGVLRAQDAS